MTDVMVVGGGPAGATLAIRLARGGQRVTLMEREAGPVDKVCGEFLSQEAAFYLASLGVDLPSLGAVPIEHVRLYEGSGVASVRLPFVAVSLSRRILDDALLTLAASEGVEVRRGLKVSALTPAGEGWVAQVENGAKMSAKTAFLATGKHDLRGHKRPAGMQDDLVAFKMHWRLSREQAAALDNHVELTLIDSGYVGLQSIENGLANLCLLVRRRRLQAFGHRWENLLTAIRAESPHLDAQLTGAQACWTRPLALSSIPYGYVRDHSEGLWCLGDQAAVIPSFSGDGISIALHSAEVAAAMFLQGGQADAYQQRISRNVRAQVVLATALSHGLVRGLGQRVLGAASRLWPGLMSAVAFHTRVSDAALARAMFPSEA